MSHERKKLQAEGLLPPFYTTAGYQILKAKYLDKGETALERYRSVAETAAKHTDDPSMWSDRFFNVMWNGWLSPATPVLTNMGKPHKGMPVSCSGQYVGDSVYDFYESLKESAVLSKNGFGTAGYFGDIRPRGSEFAGNGKASGVLPVMKQFIQMSRDVSQGSNRRGAFASYYPIDGKDFWEVADYLFNYPDDNNIGWVLTEKWYRDISSDDDKLHQEALKRFQRVMKIRATIGKGYLMKSWTAQEQRPQMYKDLGLDVKASQLCVAPETLVLTKSGYETISDLEGESLDIWNGQEWSKVGVVKTGENQKLVTVKTNSGFELTCTPYHKFYIAMRHPTSGNRWVVEKRAHELEEGDKLIKCDFPIIEGEETLDNAYANGFYSGDGCLTPSGKRIYLYGEKRNLRPILGDIFKNWYIQDDFDREYGHSDLLKDKFFVPMNNYSIESRVNWFEGICDSDGTIARNGKTQSIQIASINKDFLLDMQMMLQTMGVYSKVTHGQEAGYRSMPKNDGTGENALFNCKESYRILIGQTGVNNLQALGFSPKRLVLTDHTPNRECSHFVKVTSVVDEGRVDDTYCFTEHKRGMAVFNGILTGQCSEIMLHNSPEYTYTCVLSSMNLKYWDDWKDTDAVYVATVFLDCVAQEFIEQAKNIKGLEKAVKYTEKARSLGLGVLGLHTLYQDKMLPFESFEAMMLNAKVFKHLQKQAQEATKWMAENWGEPEWCKGYGVRNTHMLAIAPTMSTSLLMGGVSQGIEPIVMNVFTQVTAGGGVRRINPKLLEIMTERGVYNKETLNDIENNAGSIQHVKWLSDDEKAVFLTAFEINQKNLLQQASQRQKFICQAQSLNLFFDANETEEWISEVIQDFILDKNIITVYYQRSMQGVKASKGECVACEA